MSYEEREFMAMNENDSMFFSIKTDDAMKGIRMFMKKHKFYCKSGDLTKGSMQQGSGLFIFQSKSNLRFFIAYRGNREFEMIRMPEAA